MPSRAAAVRLISQSGVPSSSSGGATSVSSTCCSMCALNRYWSLRMCSGESSEKNMTSTPRVNVATCWGSADSASL